ncbi:nucleoid-associated protein YejK [Pseudomonas migulae]|nr:nucleoid-associated protein YejK [Pseudomonas migulae]
MFQLLTVAPVLNLPGDRGSPTVLFLGNSEQVESQARDDLMNQLNESYNATASKGWGFFHQESGATRSAACSAST